MQKTNTPDDTAYPVKDKSRAVAHYTAMAAAAQGLMSLSPYSQTQQLAAAQARYDALMPEELLSEDGTSLQKLGDIPVMVCYDEYRDHIEVTGILIGGDFAEADKFDGDTLQAWQDAIEAEIQQRMDGGE